MQDVYAELGLNVSRETVERLTEYEALLAKWNPAINLVAASTLSQMRTRHFLDSAQIFSLCGTQEGRWVDLGSGGGFPGLVCAILADDLAPNLQFTLVESDQRKATFLRTVARELGLSVTVEAKRIEAIPPLQADVLTARALAALPQLLTFADLHMKSDGIALFPKGRKASEEIAQARQLWSFQIETTASITDGEATILSIGDLKRG